MNLAHPVYLSPFDSTPLFIAKDLLNRFKPLIDFKCLKIGAQVRKHLPIDFSQIIEVQCYKLDTNALTPDPPERWKTSKQTNPYVITEKLSPIVYQIKVSKGKKETSLKWVHRNWIKPHKPPWELTGTPMSLLDHKIRLKPLQSLKSANREQYIFLQQNSLFVSSQQKNLKIKLCRLVINLSIKYSCLYHSNNLIQSRG